MTTANKMTYGISSSPSSPNPATDTAVPHRSPPREQRPQSVQADPVGPAPVVACSLEIAGVTQDCRDQAWILSEEEGIKHIKYAYEAGINTFEYSAGNSEVCLGKAIKAIGAPRESVVILTKVGDAESDCTSWAAPDDWSGQVYNPVGEGGVNQQGLSRKHIFESIKASLARLQMDYVDVLQCHRFDKETPIAETMQALHDVVQAGLVRYVGMSSCWAYQFQAMQNYAINNKLTPFISMQNFHNAAYREEEREMVPTIQVWSSLAGVGCRLTSAQMLGVGMIPWSPLCRGFLTRPLDQQNTTRVETDKVYKKRGHDKPDEARQEINRRIEKVSKDKGCTMAQAALAWSLGNEFISAPIVGTTSLDNMKELIEGVHIKLTKEEHEYVSEAYTPQQIVSTRAAVDEGAADTAYYEMNATSWKQPCGNAVTTTLPHARKQTEEKVKLSPPSRLTTASTAHTAQCPGLQSSRGVDTAHTVLSELPNGARYMEGENTSRSPSPSSAHVPNCPNALFTFDDDCVLVTDADEEILELYMNLASDHEPNTGGLGFVDSSKASIEIELDLSEPQPKATEVKRKGKERLKEKSTVGAVVCVTLQQDPGALKTRKGDTVLMIKFRQRALEEQVSWSLLVEWIRSDESQPSSRAQSPALAPVSRPSLVPRLCPPFHVSHPRTGIRHRSARDPALAALRRVYRLGPDRESASGAEEPRGEWAGAEYVAPDRKGEAGSWRGPPTLECCSGGGRLGRDFRVAEAQAAPRTTGGNDLRPRPRRRLYLQRAPGPAARGHAWAVLPTRRPDRRLTLFMETWLSDPSGPWTIVRLSENAMGKWGDGRARWVGWVGWR
ncbi:hypothetical protein P7C73_g5520, partial [Tremellales sp. Uapishka_1]